MNRAIFGFNGTEGDTSCTKQFSNHFFSMEEHECSDYCCWIELLSKHGLDNHSILDLVIPGTHDSATSNISIKNQYAPNSPRILRNAKKIMKGNKLKNFVAKWAIAQEKTISEQLHDGIRYFDFRVCSLIEKVKGKKDDSLYTCHSIISDKIDDILTDIKKFIDCHPKEIIILNFNHFYDVSQTQHKQLCSLFEHLFSDRMIDNTVSLRTPIKELWDNKKSIIILYENCENFEIPKDYLWPKKPFLFSAWMNSAKVTDLKKKMSKHLLERKKNIDSVPDTCNFKSKLHVTQGILTPDVGMISSSVFTKSESTSLIEVGNNVTPQFINWCIDEWKHLNLNILTVDHYHAAPFIDTVIKLNIDRFTEQAL